jgi:hypothetical protein
VTPQIIGQSEPATDVDVLHEGATQSPVGCNTPAVPVEIGGRQGPEPTRYGDWEKNGRCIDF